MWAASDILRYSLDALALGQFPSCRHDDMDFGIEDPRFSLAGKPLGFKAAVLGLKSDWDAVSSFFGTADRQFEYAPLPFLLC